MTDIDHYAYWRAARDGKKPDAHPDDPQPGFYRNDKTREPVAYWMDCGTMVCALGDRNVSLEQAQQMWQWVCDHAVTHKDYLYRMEHGRWPNENPVLLGHNQPPADMSYQSLVSVLDAIEAEAKRILAAGPAKSQDEADQASDIANELMSIEQRVTAAHRKEKAPILAQTKLVDRLWFPLRDKAEDLKVKIRMRVLTPFLVKQRRDAEIAATTAAQAGETHEPEAIRAGSLKRTTSLRTVITARIDDLHAALLFFETHNDVRELVQRLADRAVRAGVTVPGCSRMEEEKAV